MSARTAETRRAVAWVKDEPFGVEFAEVAIADDHLTATVSPSAPNRSPTGSTTSSTPNGAL